MANELVTIAEQINTAHERFMLSARTCLEQALQVGELLLAAKDQAGHGNFLQWVKAHCSFSEDQAQRYMKLHRNRDLLEVNTADSRHLISNFSVDGALNQIRDIECQGKKQARQQDLERQTVEMAQATPECPAGLFHVISVDPPWPYGVPFDSEGRRCANPYPEMSLAEIYSINLPAADDCSLFLWTTHQFLPAALAILGHWGFDYKATLVWDKQSMGLGAWVRMQCEFCLLGVKGRPLILAHDVRDIVSEQKREHSRKPEAFYGLADRLFAGRKLDYFSREPHEGWAQFGNEPAKFQ